MDMGDMYHHVPDYYRSVSEKVSNILDLIGYSQEDRDRKVLAATGLEVFVNIGDCFRLKDKGNRYIFGSRGEGSTGPGLNSDQDILYWDDKFQMVSNLSDCQPDKINFLMVYDDHTHPGYVKLQYLPDNTPESVFLRGVENFTVDSNDRTVVPNQFGREIAPGEVYSGPAKRILRDIKESCIDNVHVIPCTRWPNEANEWFQRQCSFQWLNYSMLICCLTIFLREGENLRVDSNDRFVVPNHFDRVVLSYQFGREIASDKVFSGPARRCLHNIKEACVDNVHAIRCARWPNEAHEWFQRRRPQGWPGSHHLQKARKDGCFAVAVGHPYSHESDLEWRLSFSFSERELIRSFEDTVMKVYVLLKMIKKTYIEPVLGDAFSSYHCKVCMLWMRERTPIELWRTGNLLYCLNVCMKQLYEWVSEGYCPDYFIVTNNIYDRKIFGTTQFILTRLLGVLLSEDCRMLLGLECCNLGELLLHDCSSLDMISHSITIRRKVVRETFVDYTICYLGLILCRDIMLREIPQDYNIMTSYIRCIMHALQQAPHTLRINLHHVLMVLLSRLGFHVVSVCIANAYFLSQEEVDYLMDLASMCLSLGIDSDATSVRLKLCGLGTMLGDCDLTEICLQHMSDHKMRYMISSKSDSFYTLKCYHEITYENCSRKKYSLEDMLRNQMSFSVVYLPSETHITPNPLKMEMFRLFGERSDVRNANKPFCYDLAEVDSLMCLYFFQYLNFSRLGKERHQQAALDNMIFLMRTESQMPQRETEMNLLGYCFMGESQYIDAFVCFYKSLKRCPHHNAAKFYLGILFHTIHIARLRRHRN
ncbi:hypothetical protein CHS0354_011201 [Potamilus streckersoni]|uniref:Cyclic GMP-AMP synthase n=1 Tax=Potamilus streckersoni TaxID=2493646 RepID=A0AAE0T216_9BIVA|nr:hypothetical protein CHS0354_011201 [Potamilus streckersoni]